MRFLKSFSALLRRLRQSFRNFSAASTSFFAARAFSRVSCALSSASTFALSSCSSVSMVASKAVSSASGSRIFLGTSERVCSCFALAVTTFSRHFSKALRCLSWILSSVAISFPSCSFFLSAASMLNTFPNLSRLARSCSIFVAKLLLDSLGRASLLSRFCLSFKVAFMPASFLDASLAILTAS